MRQVVTRRNTRGVATDSKTLITIRMEPEQVKQLEAAAVQLSKRAGGAPVSRSTVIRLAIERGLPLLLKK